MLNQRDEIVCDAQRAGLMLERSAAETVKTEEDGDDRHR